jgi:hypothetical protein
MLLPLAKVPVDTAPSTVTVEAACIAAAGSVLAKKTITNNNIEILANRFIYFSPFLFACKSEPNIHIFSALHLIAII